MPNSAACTAEPRLAEPCRIRERGVGLCGITRSLMALEAF